MKATRSFIMLCIALLAGVSAVALAMRWIQHQGDIKSGRIAVALMDVQLGSRLSGDLVQTVDWPSGSVPAGSFTDPKLLDGRVVKTSLTRGEPILESKLAPIGAHGGLSAVVGEGKRAITVRVNDVVGVAGFALPGNYVDIMVNTQGDGAHSNDRERAISKIVLEHILVLAVAQEANRDETKPKVVNAVTLEVTPQQAEQLDLARSVGTLSLVLRNQIDPAPAQTAGATKETLLRSADLAPAKAASANPTKVRRTPAIAALTTSHAGNCIEVIRGISKSTECF